MSNLEFIRMILAFMVLCGMIAVMVYTSQKLIYTTVETYSLDDMWKRLRDLREKLDDTEISQSDMRSQTDEQRRTLKVNANKANLMLAKLVQVEAEKDKTIADLLSKSDTLHPVVQTLENHSRKKKDAQEEIVKESAQGSDLSNSELKELFPDFDISNIRYAEGGNSFIATGGTFGLNEDDPNWDKKFMEEAKTAVGRGEDFHNMTAGMQSARSGQELDMLVKEAKANDAARFGTSETSARRQGPNRKQEENVTEISQLFDQDQKQEQPTLGYDPRY